MKRGKDIKWYALVAVILLGFGIAMNALLDDDLPRSTPSVTGINGESARLPASDTLVLSRHSPNGSTDIATITYNGQNTMQVELTLSLSSSSYQLTLCGLGCTAELDTGLFGIKLKATQHQDGAVTVNWPVVWYYRPHKA